MREWSARCAWAVGAELGEGPLWMAEQERLYFVDIKSGMLHAMASGGQRHGWKLPDYLCWLVPRRDGDGFVVPRRARRPRGNSISHRCWVNEMGFPPSRERRSS
jgi:D-xylonolactonase